jgi:hypothetical protein
VIQAAIVRPASGAHVMPRDPKPLATNSPGTRGQRRG